MLLNRKLIIAVLTIGLMLSFSSAAIGYDDVKFKPSGQIQSLSKSPTIDAGTLETIRHIPDYQKSASLTPITGQFDGNTPERLYEHLQYNDGIAWFWSIPDSYNDNKYATRMTMTADGVLRRAYVPVAQNDGVVDMRISIYGDDGGYPDPTNIIATWVVLNADLPPVGFWGYRGVEIDAGNAGGATYPDDFEFARGDEFHIVAEVDGGGEYEVSTLNFVTDDATAPEIRSSEDWNGTWYFMAEDWADNYTFAMWAEVEYDDGPLAGNCAWQSYSCGAAFLWGMGLEQLIEANGETHRGVRFSAALPETLKYVDIAFYDIVDDIGDGSGVFPTAEVIICLPDLVNGGPDIANPEHTILVAPGDQTWWTSIDMIDDEGITLVHTGDYYVVVTIEGGYIGNQNIYLLTDDGTCGTGRSGMFLSIAPGWYGYATDYNYLIETYGCTDKYSTCFWNLGPYCGYAYFWKIPGPFDGEGGSMIVTAAGTRFDPALAGCDLGEIDIWFYGGNQAEDAEMAIYSDAGGLPGTIIQYEPITGGSWPSGNFPLIQSVYFDTPIWVVIESFSATDDDIEFITDDGSCPSTRSAILVNGDWELWPYNWVMDVYQCCFPFIVRTCAPDGDWPTMGKNFARDNSTLNEFGDLQCNLTKSWTYVNSSGNGVTFAQPVIADGFVYAYMFDCLVCVDINTGDEVWRRDNNYAEVGGSCRATPTVHDGALYCGGGDGGYFSKFDITDGSTIWRFAMGGHAQIAPHVMMDVDGTEVVFVADGLGGIYGLKTSDGDNYYYPGANTPAFSTLGQIHKGLTTDGTYLYVGCDEYLTTPNVYRLAVSPAGVTEDWKLTDGVGWQLQNLVAANGWRPESSDEGCYSAILYDDAGADGQWIYFVGSFAPQGSSPVRNGGILYKVSADGTELGWAQECSGSVAGSPSGIINDKATVIFGAWSNWIEGGQYYGPMAFSKTTGLPQWGPNAVEPAWNIQTIPDNWGTVNQPGVLTCETNADPSDNDWLIFGNEFGYWNFADASAGEVVWHRRSARFLTYVTGPVADGAGHIVFGEQWNLHCLANAAPRQRLHIAEMHPSILVPFGLSSYEEIVFEDILVNSGCVEDLTIFHVELLDVDNGTFPSRVSTVHEGRAVAISSLADKNTGIKAKMSTLLDNTIDRAGVSKTTKVIAAYALPAYILAVLEPADNATIAPGAAIDIRLSIDGTKVPRGASQFYAEIHCDDPDYFLDSAYMDYGVDAADPTVLLTIVGGCLYEYTTLYFGETGENRQPVWNSTKIMDADGADEGFQIDGNTAYLFGSDGLVYCNGPERLAMFALDGYGNQTWEGILPDPLPECGFGRADNVVLAQMSNTGILPYDNVLGTILNYAYVDSIEDHRVYEIDDEVDPPETLGVTWEWDAEYSSGLNLPYSNELTEGWAFKAYVSEYAVTDVVGAKYDFDDFWNFTIARHSLFSRYGYAIPSLYVGMIADWDVDDYAKNMADYNEEFSIGWIYDPLSKDYGGGVIKIPFGPGFTPLINTVDATTSWWSEQEPNFDDIYRWMSLPENQFRLVSPFPAADKRMWNSIVELNLPKWDYTGNEEDPAPDSAFETYGYAFFGKFTDHDAAALDNYSDMAVLVNKFCGFGRGDVNNDGAINLLDIVYLNNFMFGSTPLGPIPFMHLGDVDGSGNVDLADLTYLINWYFNGGPAPVGEWALQQFVTP